MLLLIGQQEYSIPVVRGNPKTLVTMKLVPTMLKLSRIAPIPNDNPHQTIGETTSNKTGDLMPPPACYDTAPTEPAT